MSQANGTVFLENFTAADFTGDGHFVAEPNGYRKYQAIPATQNGGAQISKGAFSKVKVYCEVQEWNWGLGGVIAKTPLGTGNNEWPEGVHGPTYPNANRWGVVLVQVIEDDHNGKVQVNYTQITATDASSAQEIELDAEYKNIYIAVNDGVGDYGDNSGSFDIHVELIA